MSDHIRHRTTCRLCNGPRLARAFALTPTPPANAFVRAEARDIVQPTFPLDIFLCGDCTHLQLLDVVNSAVLFRDYVYVSGTSPTFVRHFENYALDVARTIELQGGLVIDIGSNDGTLLRPFKALGARVVGIDPAASIAEHATAAGIETIQASFTEQLAKELVSRIGQARVVTANNVLAHIDDLDDVMRGIHRLLAPDGILVFEVSYLLDVMEKTLFDTIYHEHLSYHAVRPLVRFLEAHGLELLEAVRVPTHGGSLRMTVQRKGGPRQIGASVASMLVAEEAAGLASLDTYADFASRIDKLGAELRALLMEIKAAGSRIAGFGAPAKATTMMYHFGLGPNIIDFIVDDSPLKQGLFTPGLHIPVLGADAIATRKPEYLLLLAWNFAMPIIEKNRAFKEAGGRFIIPLPELEVV